MSRYLIFLLVARQFIYDSEQSEPNLFNKLLTQIQKGVRLKKTKCNDRSRPILQGEFCTFFTSPLVTSNEEKKCELEADSCLPIRIIP